MPARVVCLSESTASGGRAIGRLVAEQLGFRHVDEEIVRRAAQRERLDPVLVGDAERRRSVVRRMLAAVSEVAVHDTHANRGLHASGADRALRALIREVIRDTADEGDVVIVSHAGSLALAGMPDVLRVFVTASDEIRARRIEGVDPLGFAAAKQRIASEDAARIEYLRRSYGVADAWPTLYDVVLSTDVLTVEQAAEIIVAAARV